MLRQRLQHAVDDRPDEVLAVVRDRSERVTVLLLPVAGLMLRLLHPTQRRFALFDHMIVSIHSPCFTSLMLMTLFLAVTVASAVSRWILLPMHLFAHLRGAHRTGIAGPCCA